MAELIIRHIEDELEQRLRQRAIRRRCSVKEEVREILRGGLKKIGTIRPVDWGSEISALFRRIGFKTVVSCVGTGSSRTNGD